MTAITRPESDTELPKGLHAVHKIGYDDHARLVKALKGQDALIITLGVSAAQDTQIKLIDAAIEAGVKYIMPNDYAADYTGALADTMLGAAARTVRKYIEDAGHGHTHWIALTCSFWYEFSLAGSELRYGFDLAHKAVTLYDDGDTPICTSSWSLCGRAVAALFALQIYPADAADATHPTLSRWHDKAAYISSFAVSQRDMLASVLRVTGDTEADWTITHEDVRKRYERGMEMGRNGEAMGMAVAIYARVFFPDGSGDYSGKVENELLGLGEEDLDECTRRALEVEATGVLRTRDQDTLKRGYNVAGKLEIHK